MPASTPLPKVARRLQMRHVPTGLPGCRRKLTPPPCSPALLCGSATGPAPSPVSMTASALWHQRTRRRNGLTHGMPLRR